MCYGSKDGYYFLAIKISLATNNLKFYTKYLNLVSGPTRPFGTLVNNIFLIIPYNLNGVDKNQ